MSGIKELAAKLARQEKTEGSSGAVPNTPKAQLFNASDVKKAKPDMHLRWVNLKNPDKVASRVAEGYRRVDGDDGRHLGSDYALYEMPEERYREREAMKAKRDRERLEAHKTEFEQVVESVARELRERHGISIKPEKLMDVRD